MQTLFTIQQSGISVPNSNGEHAWKLVCIGKVHKNRGVFLL